MWKNQHVCSDPSVAFLFNVYDYSPSHNYLGLCSLDLKVAPSVPSLQRGAKHQLLGLKSTKYVRTETRADLIPTRRPRVPTLLPGLGSSGRPELGWITGPFIAHEVSFV